LIDHGVYDLVHVVDLARIPRHDVDQKFFPAPRIVRAFNDWGQFIHVRGQIREKALRPFERFVF